MDYITDLLKFDQEFFFDERYRAKEALDHILRKSNAKDIFFCKLKPNFNFTFRPEQKLFKALSCDDLHRYQC